MPSTVSSHRFKKIIQKDMIDFFPFFSLSFQSSSSATDDENSIQSFAFAGNHRKTRSIERKFGFQLKQTEESMNEMKAKFNATVNDFV